MASLREAWEVANLTARKFATMGPTLSPIGGGEPGNIPGPFDPQGPITPGRPGPGGPNTQFDVSWFQQQNVTNQGMAMAACSLLGEPGSGRRILCEIAARTIFPGQGSTGTKPGTPLAGNGGGSSCPAGMVLAGDRCIGVGGGTTPPKDPTVFPPPSNGVGSFSPVTGSFGMAGFRPHDGTVRKLSCPRGYVLGIDEVCYAKSQMPKRSKFRKWRGQVAPPVSRRDLKAINRAARAKDDVAELAKKVGLHVSKTKGRSGHAKSTKKDHELIEKLILATRN